MTDLLLYNARIYNNDNFDTLGITDGKITLLENSKQLTSSEFSYLISNSQESVDVNQKWITPGLIDCHTHLIFAGSRANEFAARLEGASYQDIAKQGGGINSTVLSTRKASFDELFSVASNRIKQAIKNGVTTLEIKSGYGLDLDSEKKILQVADCLAQKFPVTIQKTFLGAHVVPKSDNYASPEQYINYLVTVVLPGLYKNNLIDAVDSFCEGIAFTADQLRPLYTLANDYKLKIKGHTEQLSKIGGGELICEFHGLSCDHLEYADESIVKLMQQSGVVAVLLPGAYYYLNETQKPPIDLLREYSVPIAIATDFNPGTSPILSLPIVMNMACVLYKLTPAEVWQAVTMNAAKALGLEQQLGSIDYNKQADLVIWDFQHPYDLCYYMGHDWPKQVIQNGRFINTEEY